MWLLQKLVEILFNNFHQFQISRRTHNRNTKQRVTVAPQQHQTAEQMGVHHLFLIFSLVRFICIKAKEMNSKLPQSRRASNADNIANTLNLKIVGVSEVSKYAIGWNDQVVDQDKMYTIPKIVKDEEVETETSFNNFQVVDLELNENITIAYEIDHK